MGESINDIKNTEAVLDYSRKVVSYINADKNAGHNHSIL
jgi:hypothetical protein